MTDVTTDQPVIYRLVLTVAYPNNYEYITIESEDRETLTPVFQGDYEVYRLDTGRQIEIRASAIYVREFSTPEPVPDEVPDSEPIFDLEASRRLGAT